MDPNSTGNNATAADELPSYDPSVLLAKAAEWRQAAAVASDAAHRQSCERLASICEMRVHASIATPAVAQDRSRFVSIRAADHLRRTLAAAAVRPLSGDLTWATGEVPGV